MDDSFANDGRSEATPLCYYYCACFHLQKVKLRLENDSSDDSSVLFAAGLQRIGNWEVLGAWPFQATGDEFWQRTFGDLMARGVSRITHVQANQLPDAGLIVSTATSAHSVDLSALHGLATDVLSRCGAFHALKPLEQALIRKGERVLVHLSRSLNQAVRRHGPFARVADATSFAAASLARAERRARSSSTSAPRALTEAVVRANAMHGDSWG